MTTSEASMRRLSSMFRGTERSTRFRASFTVSAMRVSVMPSRLGRLKARMRLTTSLPR